LVVFAKVISASKLLTKHGYSMIFNPVHISFYENKTNKSQIIHDVIKTNTGAKIIDSIAEGPLYLNRNTQIGPNATVGKYTGLNADCYIARAELGAFCAIGARTSFNPFNHPSDWLSTNEFQYHPQSFDWVDEYTNLKRLERTPDMFHRSKIGNDVWAGHNVNVMGGVNVGDGAILAAGSVVTKDVPPYAIVAGVPAAIIRFRFSETTIKRLQEVKWWEFELSELSGLNFRDIQEILPILEDMRFQKEEAGNI